MMTTNKKNDRMGGRHSKEMERPDGDAEAATVAISAQALEMVEVAT